MHIENSIFILKDGKSAFVFFSFHSNELSLCGCNVLFTSIGFDCDINVFRTAAADDDAVTSWCGGATQSMH